MSVVVSGESQIGLRGEEVEDERYLGQIGELGKLGRWCVMDVACEQLKLCGLITDILVLSRRIFMDPLDLPESLSFVERCRNLPDL